MKKFLILLSALFIMQTVFVFADSANDTVWTRLSHSITRLEFAPDKNYLLTCGSHGGENRKGVIIFNTEGDTVKVIYNSEGLKFRMSQGIWDAHFSNDGRYLAVIWEYDKDQLSHGMIEIFETENWTSVKKIEVPGDDFSLLGAKVLISPNNKTVVGITQDGFYFYDVQSGKLLKYLWDFGQDLTKNIIIASAIYSKDGSHIYFNSTDVKPSTTGDEKLRFLNTQTYEVDYTDDKASESFLAISQNGNMITKVLNLDELQIINPITKEIILRIPVHTEEINSMVFSPDEKYLAVNFGRGKVIHIYNIQAGKCVYQYTTVPSGYSLTGIGISPDQKYIVSSSGYIFLYKFVPTTGVGKIPDKNEDIIYPNPANGLISVRFNLSIAGFTKISVYDNLGREAKPIFQGYLEKGEQNIQGDIRGLKTGNYFVKVSSVGTDISFKLIINK